VWTRALVVEDLGADTEVLTLDPPVDGLALAGDTLTFTPTEAGTFGTDVRVTDDDGGSTAVALEFEVTAPPEPEEEPACGCAAGPSGPPVGLLLVGLGVARRRRGRAPST
jgi:MYXO-CTERM domain-containing protein